MVERGLAGPHFSVECSQSSFPASHVDSMMASRGALYSYEILNLLSPQVWTDHLQASVACGEPRDQMSPSNTHMHKHTHVCMGEKYTNVPTQDKPAGLHMLTLMDINTYNKKTLRTWEHSNKCGRRDPYNNTFPASDKENTFYWNFPSSILFSWKGQFHILSFNEYFLLSLLKQLAYAVNSDEEQEQENIYERN